MLSCTLESREHPIVYFVVHHKAHMNKAFWILAFSLSIKENLTHLRWVVTLALCIYCCREGVLPGHWRPSCMLSFTDSFSAYLQVHWHGWEIVSKEGSRCFPSRPREMGRLVLACCYCQSCRTSSDSHGFLLVIAPTLSRCWHVILTFNTCWTSECAVPVWITSQFPGLHGPPEATWAHHGFGSSSRWSLVSWIPGGISDMFSSVIFFITNSVVPNH